MKTMNTQKLPLPALRAFPAALLPLLLAASLHAQTVIDVPNGITNVTTNLTYDGSAGAQQLIIARGNTSSFLIGNSATLTISNHNNSNTPNYAGAIYVATKAKLTIAPQTSGGSGVAVFDNNTACFSISHGGGAINTSATSTLVVTNALFTNNAVALVGGAVLNTGTATVTSATFANNYANYAGALYNADKNASATLANVAFIDNRSAAGAGAV